MWGHVAGGGCMSQGLGAYGRGMGWDMWQVVGHMAGCGGMWQGVGHVTGCGGMWQGVDTCGMSAGRVWGRVAGGGCMSQGLGAYGRGRGWDMCQVVGHMAGCGGMWQGEVAYGRVWAHVAGVGACHKG